MTEWLVLVDENDRELGVDSRENCHIGTGKMHRAFVIFLFDSKGRLLVQRRSSKKLLWPGYWDVTTTSHVYPEENYEQASRRRLMQELGIQHAPVERVLSFSYFASFGEYSENEYCVLLVGGYDGQIMANDDEVAEYKHVAPPDLERDLRENPNTYTPWFKIALSKFLEYKRGSSSERSFAKR